MRTFLLAIFLFACPLVLASSDERSVTVVAEGYVEAVPDTLEFTITGKSTRPNLSSARVEVDAVVADAIKLARSLKLDDEDIDGTEDVSRVVNDPVVDR